MSIEKLYKFSEVSEILWVTKHCLHVWADEEKIEAINIAPKGHKRALRVKEGELKRITNSL